MSKLEEKFNKYVFSKRIPIRGLLQLTYKCNFQCLHCYETPLKGKNEKELDTQSWYSIIDILKEQGCLYLTFTGGECFTRSDFINIYRYAYNKNFKISIISNGSLITDSIIDEFILHKPNSITISLYGNSNSTYNKFTKSVDKYDTVINNIKKLHEIGIYIRVSMIANTINKMDVIGARNLIESLGIEFYISGKIKSYINGDSEPLKYQLSPEEYFNLLEKKEIEAINKEYESVDKYWTHNGIKKCTAGLTNIYINPYGYIYLCNELDDCKYSILDNSFEYCWSQIEELRKKTIEIKTICSDCNNRNICGLCGPMLINEYGSTDKCPKERCQYGRKMKMLFDEVQNHGTGIYKETV